MPLPVDPSHSVLREESGGGCSTLQKQVRAGTALLTAIVFLWLGLVSLASLPTGLAAGSGGLGSSGSGGSGTGTGGTNEGGAAGNSSDPGANAGSQDPLPSSGNRASSTDSSVATTDPGLSNTKESKRQGDLDFQLTDLPQAASGGGDPPAGRGGGSGNDGTEFFGVRSYGKKFVYVVDRSGSMNGLPLERAKAELSRSIRELNAGQRVYVIFFDDSPLCQFNEAGPPKSLSRAIPSERRRLLAWIDSVASGGGTDPELAMRWAIDLKPDAIFLLSDGEFVETIVDTLTAQNSTSRIPIHTIAFINRSGEQRLKDLASKNSGTFRFQP